jgi:hypothetical protein
VGHFRQTQQEGEWQMRKMRQWMLLAGGVLAPIMSSGCYSLGYFVPIPVPAWVSERMVEKYSFDSDHRTPIMPPIREGYPPPLCEDPPDQATVLRALTKITRGIPYLYEEFRDDIQVVTERVVDKIDPPRFFPLVGPAQLHHCHWKCTVYYTETIESGWPFPFQTRKPRVEVVMIDRDHLHLYTCDNNKNYPALSKDLVGH